MDNKAYIKSLVNANFAEIDKVMADINERMQATIAGSQLTKALDYLLSEIQTEYDIYANAHQYGHNELKIDDSSVSVRNAIINLKKAYAYFQNPPVIIFEDKNKYHCAETEIQQKNIYTPPNTDWLTLDEVCNEFRLSKNNIKDKQWRDKNKFPYHQDGGAYSSVRYNRQEINEWMERSKR